MSRMYLSLMGCMGVPHDDFNDLHNPLTEIVV